MNYGKLLLIFIIIKIKYYYFKQSNIYDKIIICFSFLKIKYKFYY